MRQIDLQRGDRDKTALDGIEIRPRAGIGRRTVVRLTRKWLALGARRAPQDAMQREVDARRRTLAKPGD